MARIARQFTRSIGHQLTLEAARSDFGVEVVPAWKGLPPRDYR